MLELLIEYGRKHGLAAEPGFAPRDVKWALEFATDGRFLGVLPLGNTDEKKNPGQTFPRCPELTQGELVGGTEERCHFLVESAQVVALHMKGDEDDKTLARLRGKHAFYVKMLREAVEVLPETRAIADSLETPTCMEVIAGRLKEAKAKVTDRVTIRVSDAYPVESEAWHDWWRAFRSALGAKPPSAGQSPVLKQSIRMRCFATGEFSTPLLTHPKILGLSDVGGLATGDALICFDKDAFTSYGLDQSTNGAVSEQAAAEYRAALNDLIKNHGRRLAGGKVVYWFKEKIKAADDPIPLLLETPEQEERSALQQAQEKLDAIRTGKRPDLASNRFYSFTISGAAGRVMVRDWMEGSFEQLQQNVVRWFDDLSIEHREGGRLANDPKFMAVLGGTVRELDNLVPPFVGKMWRVAVAGEAMPSQAMTQALSRCKLDFIQANPLNHARVGLLKACLIRAKKGVASMGPYLNEDHPSPAYQCGRLMSVLADLQYDALGDVGAGVVQRYYAAASSTPALVLGRLVRNAQFHIGKSKYPGPFQDRISKIWSRIKDLVPTTLTLEEQTLFALGYYQQMASDRAARQSKAESKTAK